MLFLTFFFSKINSIFILFFYFFFQCRVPISFLYFVTVMSFLGSPSIRNLDLMMLLENS